MRLFTGYYYCNKSNWDNTFFEAKNLVVIDEDTKDFEKLIEKKLLPPDEVKTYDQLKPEVSYWLHKNIKNNKEKKGWCCGNKVYSSHGEAFSLFFHRNKDAKLFIETFSEHKKATETYNQNTYIKAKLDLKTNTYKRYKSYGHK